MRLVVVLPVTPSLLSSPSSYSDIVENGERELSNHVTDSNLVLIGIMTTEAFLETRAVAAYETWVSSVPGKVRPRDSLIFFASVVKILSFSAG